MGVAVPRGTGRGDWRRREKEGNGGPCEPSLRVWLMLVLAAAGWKFLGCGAGASG